MEINNNIFELLARQFKTPQYVANEIINLQAILNLPKGTEHFLSDLHGESQIFSHLLKNASGVIKIKINEVFNNTLSDEEKNQLATLIYYPKEKLSLIKNSVKDIDNWYKTTLLQLIVVAKEVASKYTRSKVRNSLDKKYVYILDELINMSHKSILKQDYYNEIIESIIELDNADDFIIALSNLIQRLAIDHLHIVGDIYDRGNGSHSIVESLMNYHSLDIQWGNHDVLWIGAYAGNLACICNVIRINCIYRNLTVLENGYAINLRPLATFAQEEYADDDCNLFKISNIFGVEGSLEKNVMLAKISKAITVIQLKLENQLITKHQEFNMNDRMLYTESQLTEKEIQLINHLKNEFTNNKKLKTHLEFIVNKGSMHLCYNGNLLMHGCVPTNSDGTFTKVNIDGQFYSGKRLYNKVDTLVRKAIFEKDEYSVDYLWYLWCGKSSPLYGRDKMCVYTKYFENYTETENKDYYYKFIKTEEYCFKVLAEFGLDIQNGHIINGHMPVNVNKGQSPETANGRHITIDGGLSKAYHQKTGIGGYTLINNSQGLFLVSHSPIFSAEDILNSSIDLCSQVRCLQMYENRILVKDTDKGLAMQQQILILKEMLRKYFKRI